MSSSTLTKDEKNNGIISTATVEQDEENNLNDRSETSECNLYNDTSFETMDEDGSTEETKSSKEEEWLDLLGSRALLKKIIKEGEPDTRPQRSEKCVINYTCSLKNGIIVESKSNYELYLGESDVVQGLDVALGLMNLKEKCILKIQPRLAFGSKGQRPKVPPNSVVLYNVELVTILPEEQIDTLSIQQRKRIGKFKRERGNWWYCRGENTIAIQCYRRALDYLDEVEGGIMPTLADGDKIEVTDADLQSLLEDRVSVCNNMAAAQLKMELYDAALNSLQIVLRCQPNNVKAHFRKAKVYVGKNDMPTAMKCLQKAKELAPNDIEIQKEINFVTKLLGKQKNSERELARRMFNVSKKEHRNSRGKKSNGKLSLWTTLGATVAVGVAGLVAYRFKYA